MDDAVREGRISFEGEEVEIRFGAILSPGCDAVDVRSPLNIALEVVAVHEFVKEGLHGDVLETEMKVGGNLGEGGGAGAKSTDRARDKGRNGGEDSSVE